MNGRRFPINRNVLLIKAEYAHEARGFVAFASLIATLRTAMHSAVPARNLAISRMIVVTRNKWDNSLGCFRLTTKIFATRLILAAVRNKFTLRTSSISTRFEFSITCHCLAPGLLFSLATFRVRHAIRRNPVSPDNWKLYCVANNSRDLWWRDMLVVYRCTTKRHY